MRYDIFVRDVLFVAMVVAFFAIAALFVAACQRFLAGADLDAGDK